MLVFDDDAMIGRLAVRIANATWKTPHLTDH
jgi:hypothetical protein